MVIRIVKNYVMKIYIDNQGVEFVSPDYPNCRITGSSIVSCQDCRYYRNRECEAPLPDLKEARMYILAYLNNAEEIYLNGIELSQTGKRHLIGLLKSL